jgi:MATE family multidrug resistance protein
MAGAGLGGSIFFAIAIIGMGVVLGTEPVIAQALGGKDPKRARRTFRQGVWLALIAGPIVMVLAWVMAALLPYTGVDGDVVPEAQHYMMVRAPSAIPFLLYWSVKAWLQAHGKTRAPVVGVVIGLVLEVILDILLVFGNDTLGIPVLGVVGAGIANCTSTTVRLLVVVVAAESALLRHEIAGEPVPLSLRERAARMKAAWIGSELWTITRIGLPLGLQLALEVAVFTFAAMTMGRIGSGALAAHQVAIQCASTTFNLMVGLGSATSVVVGRRIGAGDKAGALRAGVAAFVLSCITMLATGALFLFGGHQLGRMMTDQQDVIDAAAGLLAIAAAFQIADGLQAVASGALRGAGDTRVTMVIHLLAHWGVGMPLLLILSGPLGPAGVWWGLTLGLTVAATALVLRFLIKAKRGYAPI